MIRSALIIFMALKVCAFASPYPPVEVDPSMVPGCALQRTMSLLATSTPEQRHTVRILFYGQSITEQAWWQTVAEDLRTRFPHANLIITNRAIGGYQAEFLVRTAESDVFPFYPDLVIFHAYGSLTAYEGLLRQIRERTTSEILIQTDHVTLDEELTEETDPANSTGMTSQAYRNYVALPSLAKKYGACLADVRSGWKKYLQTHGLSASSILRDHIHLNSQGEYVMAELVKPYLRHDPALFSTRWRNAAKTLFVGQDLSWTDGALELDFQGNRVDVIFQSGADGTITNYIDGLPPSAHAESYSYTRSTPPVGTWRPALLGVKFEAIPLLEEWTLTITNYDAATRQVGFQVEASVTGFDGGGTSAQRFVSNSRRIILEPEAWGGARAMWWTYPPEPGFQIKWGVTHNGLDLTEVPPQLGPGIEQAATIIQGIPAGPHRLRIEASPEVPIQAIRVFNPAGMIVPGQKPYLASTSTTNGAVILGVVGEGPFQLEMSSSPSNNVNDWQPVGPSSYGPFLSVDLIGEQAFFRVYRME